MNPIPPPLPRKNKTQPPKPPPQKPRRGFAEHAPPPPPGQRAQKTRSPVPPKRSSEAGNSRPPAPKLPPRMDLQRPEPPTRSRKWLWAAIALLLILVAAFVLQPWQGDGDHPATISPDELDVALLATASEPATEEMDEVTPEPSSEEPSFETELGAGINRQPTPVEPTPPPVIRTEPPATSASTAPRGEPVERKQSRAVALPKPPPPARQEAKRKPPPTQTVKRKPPPTQAAKLERVPEKTQALLPNEPVVQRDAVPAAESVAVEPPVSDQQVKPVLEQGSLTVIYQGTLDTFWAKRQFSIDGKNMAFEGKVQRTIELGSWDLSAGEHLFQVGHPKLDMKPVPFVIEPGEETIVRVRFYGLRWFRVEIRVNGDTVSKQKFKRIAFR